MNQTSSQATGRPKKAEISEEEFAPLVCEQARDFLLLGNSALSSPPEHWRQRRIYLLYRFATDVETFLDDFGAKENRRFHRLRELTAMVRWLALGMSALSHLDSRLPYYATSDSDWVRGALAPQVRGANMALGGMIQGCFQALRENWEASPLPWPQGELSDVVLESPETRRFLPRDLAEDPDPDSQLADGTAPAIRLAARYLKTLEQLESAGLPQKRDLDGLRHYMATRCTEENARTYEARVHNLQSYYDSQVAGVAEEKQHPELALLRGAISLSLHLLEAITALTHLYERHDAFERRGPARELFEQLIDEHSLLDIIVNTCILGVYKSFEIGGDAARSVLGELTEQQSCDLPIPNGVTLHARPISLIVSVVNHHGTPVEVEIAGQSCSGASIMQLLVLVGSHPDAQSMRFTGDRAVLSDLAQLFEGGLGEDGLQELPDTLGYLKPAK